MIEFPKVELLSKFSTSKSVSNNFFELIFINVFFFFYELDIADQKRRTEMYPENCKINFLKNVPCFYMIDFKHPDISNIYDRELLSKNNWRCLVPLDIGRKLNVLCTFNLDPLPRGVVNYFHKKSSNILDSSWKPLCNMHWENTIFIVIVIILVTFY